MAGSQALVGKVAPATVPLSNNTGLKKYRSKRKTAIWLQLNRTGQSCQLEPAMH